MMRIATILLICFAIEGCATAPQQSFCATVREPILIDKNDKLSPATARRIVGLNESGVLLCGWKAPGAK